MGIHGFDPSCTSKRSISNFLKSIISQTFYVYGQAGVGGDERQLLTYHYYQLCAPHLCDLWVSSYQLVSRLLL